MVRMATIEQFAHASSLSKKHAGDFLHFHYRHGHLGMCGGRSYDGHGRVPKVYYFTRKGWKHFTEEEINLGEFVNVKPKKPWTQTLPHRLQIVSNYQDLGTGLALSRRGWINDVLFDFRTAKYRGKTRKETTDFVSDQMANDTKIVPDAAMHISRSLEQSGLFFLETDMGTELLNPSPATDQTLLAKIRQYERYYDSGHYQDRYRNWGNFSAFFLLIATKRREHAKKIAFLKDEELHISNQFMLVSTHEEIRRDPFDKVWWKVGQVSSGPQPLW